MVFVGQGAEPRPRFRRILDTHHIEVRRHQPLGFGLTGDHGVHHQLQRGVGVRADVKDALARAAEADGRSVSSLTDRILRAWLSEHGHLAGPKGTKATKPRKKPEGA